MATEIKDGALKFTVELGFDDKKANQSLGEFLKKMQNKVSNVSQNSTEKPTNQYNSILNDASQTLGEFLQKNKKFYVAIAQSEMGLQKVRNEQNMLNTELRNGLVSEQEYINKTSQLTQIREKLSQQLKDNRAQLQQYNSVATAKPAFTRQDTLNELASAHGANGATASPNLSATEAFARATQQSVDKLNLELTELENKLKSGAITNDQYAKSISTVNDKLAAIKTNQEYYNKNAGKDVVIGNNIQNDVKEQIGLIEKAKLRLNELKAQATKALDTPSLGKINKEIEAYNKEIKRLTGLGTQAFELQNKSMNAQEGILQRLQRAANLYQRGIVEATRVENIDKYSQKLNAVNAEMARLTKGTNIGTGWNGLQNSINQISRELPAFTYSIQTGFMAISNNIPIAIDQISRLRKENEQLAASGQKGVPVWKQLVSGIFSWQTAMSLGITILTIYGKEIGNFFTELFKGKTAISQAKRDFEALNVVMSESSKQAAKEVTQLKILSTVAQDVTKSTKERKEATKQLQELGKTHNVQLKTEAVLAGEAADQYRELSKSILEVARSKAAQGKIEENEAKRLDLAFKKQKVQNENVNEKKRYSQQGNDSDRTIGGGTLGTYTEKGLTVSQKQLGSDLRANKVIKEIDNEINALDKTSEFLMKYVKVQEEIKKTGKTGSGIKEEKLFDQILKSRTDAYDKILQIDKEYAMRSLSDDDKEIQAVRNKFDEIRKVLEEENKKLIDYNKKNGKNVPLINIGELDKYETSSIKETQENQANKANLKAYEEDYKKFVQYEQLKNEAGQKYADEQLGKYKGTVSKLQNEIRTLNLKKSTQGLSQIEDTYLKNLEKLSIIDGDRLIDEAQKNFVTLLNQYETYYQKRERMITEANKKIAILEAKGEHERAKEVQKATDENLKKSFKEEIEDNPELKKLQKNLDNTSRLVLPKALKLGKETVKGIINGLKKEKPELTKELDALQAEYDKTFDKGIASAKDGKYEEIASLVSGFDQLVNMATQFDGTMGSALKTVGSMVSQVATLTKTLSETLGSVGKGLSSTGGIGAIVGAVLSVVGSVISIIDNKRKKESEDRQRAREYQQDYNLKQISAINRALEYQLSIVNEIYGIDRIKSFAEIVKSTTDEVNNNLLKFEKNARGHAGTKFLLTGNKRLDDLINEYNNLKESDLRRERTNVNSGKSYSIADSLYDDIMSYRGVEKLDLGFKSIEEITVDHIAYMKDLIERDKLDETTAAIVQSLIDGWSTYKDAMNQLTKEMTGTSFEGLLNDVKSLFSNNGVDSAEAWAKGFDKIMESYIMNKFSREYLETALQGWYTMFDDFAKDGLDEEEKKILKDAYDGIKTAGEARKKEIEDSIGFSADSSSSLKSESIARQLTEQTGTEIVGMYRAGYDIQKQMLLTLSTHTTQQTNYLMIANDQLASLNSIQFNTANTVLRLDITNQKLDQVIRGLRGG